MSKSNYLEDKVLDHALGTSAFTAPTATYLALFTSDPAEDASGTEVSGNGYSRNDIDFNAASGGSATGPVSDSEFTASGGSFGTITHFAIFDASTAGNMLYYGALSASKTVADGDSIRFVADSITITEG
jgi:hypothetical protein